jgi:hypothetical protein
MRQKLDPYSETGGSLQRRNLPPGSSRSKIYKLSCQTILIIEEIVEHIQTPHKYLPSCTPSQAMGTSVKPVYPFTVNAIKGSVLHVCTSILL